MPGKQAYAIRSVGPEHFTGDFGDGGLFDCEDSTSTGLGGKEGENASARP
jgi:hypothetical protein